MFKLSNNLKRIEYLLAKISDLRIFWVFAFAGFVSSLILRSYLKDLPYQFGVEALGLFIPPFLASLYMAICGFKNGFSDSILIKVIVLYGIQIIPFGNLLFQVILPNPGEDFARNFAYAQNMVDHYTLWGGDKIAYPEEGNAFITQPGHRYFIAFELILFRDLYRFVSVLNALLFVISLFFFMKALFVSLGRSLFMALLTFFLVMTVPYAVKNILMGLNEWLMIVFLMLSVYFYKVRGTVILSIVFLALVPFIRQNTLPAVLLIALWLVIGNKNKLLVSGLFLFILMLPVYHNLYYAGELRFFASIHQWPFLSYATPSKYEAAIGINYMKVINNFLHYIAIHIRGDNSIDLMEESFCFLWMFPFIYYTMQKKYFRGFYRWFFLIVTLSVIIPTFFIATHFYPRFEFVCIFVALSVFTFLIRKSTPIHSSGF